MKPLIKYLQSSRTIRRLHLTSIDPCRHALDSIYDTITAAIRAGTDGFLLGGSTGVDRGLIDSHSRAIHQALVDAAGNGPRLPLILFPSSAQTGVTELADGVLFLSLLNTREVRYLIREQAKAAPFLPMLGLEPLGCGMIYIEPGGTGGRVGQADLIKPDDIPTALGYAMAAAAFGFPLIYLNAGSGSDRPVPAAMIQVVSQALETPLIVGGGITDAEKAADAAQSGADIIVTGSAVESRSDVYSAINAIAAAIHAVAPARSQ